MIASKKTLMEYNYTVTVRKTRGDDIDAACGQLVGDVIDRTKRTKMLKAASEANLIAGDVIQVKAV